MMSYVYVYVLSQLLLQFPYRLPFDHPSDLVCSQRLVFHQGTRQLQTVRNHHSAILAHTHPMQLLLPLLQ